MLLEITHTTKLTYSDLISESVMELRMTPRQEDIQHRLSFSLAIGPPTAVTSYFDFMDNTVHCFTINPFHDRIRIIANSVVETEPAASLASPPSDTWPIDPQRLDFAFFDALRFDGPIVDCPALRDLANALQPMAGAPLHEVASNIMHRVHARFTYRKGVTSAASPITEILEHGAGVCQDFAQLMVAMGRALGIPSRYVGGYVHPLANDYRGFAESHAWCEMYFPSVGWIGFDPANDLVANESFVKVGVGRDFRDVAPNRGVYRGSATESIDVTVTSKRLAGVPAELSAERHHALDVPIHPGTPAEPRPAVQQQEQQQQE